MIGAPMNFFGNLAVTRNLPMPVQKKAVYRFPERADASRSEIRKHLKYWSVIVALFVAKL